jgi:hypothetical protein
MTSHTGANLGCLLVGDYADEGEVPEGFASLQGAASRAQVERPRLVAGYLDEWSPEDGVRQFTVLLRDDRVVTVRGHSLKHVQHAANPTDPGSYGILLRAGEDEVLIALFRVSEVTGIFSGELRRARESA